MKVKSESEVTELCPTLSDPMDCSLPGSSIHGIFQARVLEWVVIASPKQSSKAEIDQVKRLVSAKTRTSFANFKFLNQLLFFQGKQ